MLCVCGVCGIRKAIWVASTSMPYSCWYCESCLTVRADPEIVFICWAADGVTPDKHRCPGLMLTWKDGQYWNYSQWYERWGRGWVPDKGAWGGGLG